MRITIHEDVLQSFPEATLGFVIADVVVEPTHPYVEKLKKDLPAHLERMGITAENIAAHPDIARWREVYRSFGVKPSKYRSSVESLVRRLLKGHDLYGISSLVDLYNCVSVQSLLPLGAYDLERIAGDIELRYGRDGEVIEPLGSKDPIVVSSRHVIYADHEKVLCHLWNYRDSRQSAITAQTRHAIFFVDAAFPPQETPVSRALELLIKQLTEVGANIRTSGQLSIAQTYFEG